MTTFRQFLNEEYFPKTREEVEKLLDTLEYSRETGEAFFNKSKVIINNDLSIDYDGDFTLNLDLLFSPYQLPLKFRNVKKFIMTSDENKNTFKSLEGLPSKCEVLDLYRLNVKNLKHITQDTERIHLFNYTLDSLEGINEKNENLLLNIVNCKISDFSNIPKKLDSLYIRGSNFKQEDFKHLPQSADYINVGMYNEKISLKGIHKTIKSCRMLAFGNSTVVEGGLGLLKIKNLRNIHIPFQDYNAEDIIQKYIINGGDILACQQELIEAGLEEYAQL